MFLLKSWIRKGRPQHTRPGFGRETFYLLSFWLYNLLGLVILCRERRACRFLTLNVNKLCIYWQYLHEDINFECYAEGIDTRCCISFNRLIVLHTFKPDYLFTSLSTICPSLDRSPDQLVHFLNIHLVIPINSLPSRYFAVVLVCIKVQKGQTCFQVYNIQLMIWVARLDNCQVCSLIAYFSSFSE